MATAACRSCLRAYGARPSSSTLGVASRLAAAAAASAHAVEAAVAAVHAASSAAGERADCHLRHGVSFALLNPTFVVPPPP